jgi:hypothetical protein
LRANHVRAEEETNERTARDRPDAENGLLHDNLDSLGAIATFQASINTGERTLSSRIT